MFRTTIQYTDFLGNTQEETLRFNLTEDQLRTLITEDKDFDPSYLAYVSSEQDFQAMYKLVRKLILFAYGEMTEDAKYFNKSPEISNRFQQSAMYQAFLDDLMEGQDISKLNAFVAGVFPKKFADEIQKRMNDNTLNVVK